MKQASNTLIVVEYAWQNKTNVHSHVYEMTHASMTHTTAVTGVLRWDVTLNSTYYTGRICCQYDSNATPKSYNEDGVILVTP